MFEEENAFFDLPNHYNLSLDEINRSIPPTKKKKKRSVGWMWRGKCLVRIKSNTNTQHTHTRTRNSETKATSGWKTLRGHNIDDITDALGFSELAFYSLRSLKQHSQAYSARHSRILTLFTASPSAVDGISRDFQWISVIFCSFWVILVKFLFLVFKFQFIVIIFDYFHSFKSFNQVLTILSFKKNN